MSAEPAIYLDGVRFSYARKGPVVLDMDRFEVAAGEKVFLKGASGSEIGRAHV